MNRRTFLLTAMLAASTFAISACGSSGTVDETLTETPSIEVSQPDTSMPEKATPEKPGNDALDFIPSPEQKQQLLELLNNMGAEGKTDEEAYELALESCRIGNNLPEDEEDPINAISEALGVYSEDESYDTLRYYIVAGVTVYCPGITG